MVLCIPARLYAQYTPPSMSETVSFLLPQLQSKDTLLMHNLEDILLKEGRMRLERSVFKDWNVFNIVMEQKDSVQFCIYVELSEYPMAKGYGYIERNDYLYVLKGDTGKLFIPLIKKKKRFSYTQTFEIIDPPFWILEYNIQSHCLRLVEVYNL